MYLRQHRTTVTRNIACCDDGSSVSYLYVLLLITSVNSRGCEGGQGEQENTATLARQNAPASDPTRDAAERSTSHQSLCISAGWTAAQRTLPTSTLCKSSSAHVFPIENDPFAFCFALWSL